MLDSYEVDPANDWTPDFLNLFTGLFGYDPLPYLPALHGVVIDNQDITKRFLHNYHKAVGEIMVSNHFVKTRDILNQSGLKLLAEAGHGGYARVDPLKGLGLADAKNLFGARGVVLPSRSTTNGYNNALAGSFAGGFWVGGAGWAAHVF